MARGPTPPGRARPRRAGLQGGDRQEGRAAGGGAVRARRQGAGEPAPRPRHAGLFPGRRAGLAGADQCGAQEGGGEVRLSLD